MLRLGYVNMILDLRALHGAPFIQALEELIEKVHAFEMNACDEELLTFLAEDPKAEPTRATLLKACEASVDVYTQRLMILLDVAFPPTGKKHSLPWGPDPDFEPDFGGAEQLAEREEDGESHDSAQEDNKSEKTIPDEEQQSDQQQDISDSESEAEKLPRVECASCGKLVLAGLTTCPLCNGRVDSEPLPPFEEAKHRSAEREVFLRLDMDWESQGLKWASRGFTQSKGAADRSKMRRLEKRCYSGVPVRDQYGELTGERLYYDGYKDRYLRDAKFARQMEAQNRDIEWTQPFIDEQRGQYKFAHTELEERRVHLERLVKRGDPAQAHAAAEQLSAEFGHIRAADRRAAGWRYDPRKDINAKGTGKGKSSKPQGGASAPAQSSGGWNQSSGWSPGGWSSWGWSTAAWSSQAWRGSSQPTEASTPATTFGWLQLAMLLACILLFTYVLIGFWQRLEWVHSRCCKRSIAGCKPAQQNTKRTSRARAQAQGSSPSSSAGGSVRPISDTSSDMPVLEQLPGSPDVVYRIRGDAGASIHSPATADEIRRASQRYPVYQAPPCHEDGHRWSPEELRQAGLPFLTEAQRQRFQTAAQLQSALLCGDGGMSGVTLEEYEEDRRNQQLLDSGSTRHFMPPQAGLTPAPSMYPIDQSESVRWVNAGHIRSRTVGIQSATTYDQRTVPARFKARSQGFRRADEITFGLALPGQREFRIYTHIAMGYQEYDPALEHTALHADPLSHQRGDFGEAHASAPGPSSSSTSQQMPARDLGDEQLPRRRRGRAANND